MNTKSLQVFESLEAHLAGTDEIVLVVLRGHLILESCLNRLLTRWIEPERLPRLNMTFAKKLDLYEALADSTGIFWSEEIAQLRDLNRIRNKLAHQLPETPGFHADLKKWACGVVGYTPKTIQRRVTYRRTVLKALYWLTGSLAGAASAADEIKGRTGKPPA